MFDCPNQFFKTKCSKLLVAKFHRINTFIALVMRAVRVHATATESSRKFNLKKYNKKRYGKSKVGVNKHTYIYKEMYKSVICALNFAHLSVVPITESMTKVTKLISLNFTARTHSSP